MADSATPAVKLNKVDQIGIVVRDAGKVMASWTTLFGIGPWTERVLDMKDVDGKPGKVRLCFADLGGIQLELIEPVEGRIFHSQHLDEHGEGLHHLGFRVDDVDAEAENVVGAGGKVMYARPDAFSYLDTGGPGGVIFEMIRAPR